jgi:S-adenosylmethionine:tRNA ribosyltransferase-isomerase
MRVSQLDYNLPKNLIAHCLIQPRDYSKLLVIDRARKKIAHHRFYELPNLLTKRDVLVFNQSKVFPARLIGQKDTGGKLEILLLKKRKDHIWSAMFKGKLKKRQTINFGGTFAKVKNLKGNIAEIEFNKKDNFWKFIEKEGKTPLPPYIEPKNKEKNLRKSYQTVYAKEKGSVAAPTAGFHFTKKLLLKLKKKGVGLEFITLHVGLGTFAPIKDRDIKKHQIHSETFVLPKDVVLRLNKAKGEGKRIIAVGTTTTRVLETCSKDNKLIPKSGETKLFIYPPYKFKFVDSLITNFHLPKSTLLALVSAFVSYPNTNEGFRDFKSSLIGKAYKEAVRKNYRFYSFGDACFIQ